MGSCIERLLRWTHVLGFAGALRQIGGFFPHAPPPSVSSSGHVMRTPFRWQWKACGRQSLVKQGAVGYGAMACRDECATAVRKDTWFRQGLNLSLSVVGAVRVHSCSSCCMTVGGLLQVLCWVGLSLSCFHLFSALVAVIYFVVESCRDIHMCQHFQIVYSASSSIQVRIQSSFNNDGQSQEK